MSGATRTIEQWHDIFTNLPNGAPANAVNCAYRLMGDITGYSERGGNKDTDADQIANAMLAFKRITEATPTVVPIRKKKKSTSRSARWAEAVSEVKGALSTIGEGMSALETATENLNAVREEYVEWKDNMHENLANSPMVEKLQAIEDLDVESIHSELESAFNDAESKAEEAESMDLPMGFGRD